MYDSLMMGESVPVDIIRPYVSFFYSIGIGIFYLFDRQLHNIGEIISKCKIILSGDSHKGTNWPLT